MNTKITDGWSAPNREQHEKAMPTIHAWELLNVHFQPVPITTEGEYFIRGHVFNDERYPDNAIIITTAVVEWYFDLRSNLLRARTRNTTYIMRKCSKWASQDMSEETFRSGVAIHFRGSK